MSGDQTENGNESREAHNVRDEFIGLARKDFHAWGSDEVNINRMKLQAAEVQEAFGKKWSKMCVGEVNPLAGAPIVPESKPEAPAIMKERSVSEKPMPPESPDIEYLAQEEVLLGDQISTLTTMLVPDENGKTFMERCVGRSNDATRKLQVVRIPAREVVIEPHMVIQFLGNVVADLNAVHTGNVLYQKRRFGYSFDRFFKYDGKREARCCLVLDRVHQAGLVYEKWVDKQSRKPFPRIRQQSDPRTGQPTGAPKYRLIGAKETDYRDLKKLFVRHFLKLRREDLADDVGLQNLMQAYE